VAKRSEVNLIWRGESAMKQIEKQAYDKLYVLGEDLVTKIKDFLSQQGTGRIYKTGKTVWHQASAPGFPPVVWTGELKGTFSHVVITEGKMIFLYLGTPKDYGLYLEIGTKFMKARPWLAVFLTEHTPEIKSYLIKEWVIV